MCHVYSSAVLEKASNSLEEYKQANITKDLNPKASVPRNPQRQHQHSNSTKHWQKPNNGVIKINCDANLSRIGRWGLGAAFRDSAATWEMAGYAIYQAVLLAIDCCFREVIVESDNRVVINLLKETSRKPRSYLGDFVWGINCNRNKFMVCLVVNEKLRSCEVPIL
ncbi:hypothetical protein A2U01_0012128 [Trifolium medium]|uniref:RNase H type-1 domain-containing protein n=1 Tax=Trifolium medium TaxID=97028 RepID=A0A392MV83_9FABA|nr:hypothetical protein [Trifolium medium]